MHLFSVQNTITSVIKEDVVKKHQCICWLNPSSGHRTNFPGDAVLSSAAEAQQDEGESGGSVRSQAALGHRDVVGQDVVPLV